MNCFCDRLRDLLRDHEPTAAPRRARSAPAAARSRTSCTSTPTTVSSEVSSWLSVCCRLCAMLSMSLVTRLSSSPRGWLSKYGSGSRLSLSSTSARSLRIALLHHAVEQVALQPEQHAGARRRGRARAAGSARAAAKSMPTPGTTLIRSSMSAMLSLPAARAAVDGLVEGGAGGQLLADHAGEDDVGGVPEDLRPDHRQRHAGDAEQR